MVRGCSAPEATRFSWNGLAAGESCHERSMLDQTPPRPTAQSVKKNSQVDQLAPFLLQTNTIAEMTWSTNQRNNTVIATTTALPPR